MKITHIRLYQYRNHLDLAFSPAATHNVLYGNNAAGKTNILEAVVFCLTGGFLRNATEKDLIHYEKDTASVAVSLEEGIRTYEIQVILRRDRAKEIRVNGEKIRSLRELDRVFPISYFTPEDLRIAKDSPQYRRRFIDALLSDVSVPYKNALSAYHKALLQRNTLLKSAGTAHFMRQLNAIDAQLIKAGCYIMAKRDEMVQKVRKEAAPVHAALTDEKEDLRVFYQSDIEGKEEPVKDFLQALSDNLEKDRRLKSTGRGPHRDDLALFINEHPLRLFGSQGQQRTAVLSLKLAEAKIKQKEGVQPVLLLDDVYSELDTERQKMIASITEEHQLMTTTVDIPHGNNEAVWHLENGRMNRKR
ncbi:MAG: DNA replication/repair protein RecF [Tissierellia bacterium]|jgi:DNA replication and repair protein RecF|nr:DNA replication/repair protein RecF [Bacillota bacterium]NLK59031.1 DNA replication/repair protein RecF [Tissierellia bacterium]